MSFKELKLKSSYDTGEDDVVEAFYIPVLSKAISYDRIAGYFTSSSLAISARGLQYMIQKKGKMRLLVSPYLNREDVEMMQQASVDPMGYLEQSLADVLEEMNDHNLQHYRALMGWMIAHNLLEIKVVLIKHKDGRLLSRDEVDQTALFHQKIGICRDEEGSILTFSGSINETAAAWTKNVENFKVFQSWKAGQEEFCNTDAQNFLKYWYEEKEHVVIMNIPMAIRDKFIQYGDKDITEINSAIQQMKITKKEETISLFYYQKQAVEQWKKNKRHLLFEMATGSGKTRTAIACMLDLVNQNERNLFIVATPQSTLSKQWKTEVEAFYPTAQFSLVVDSTNTKAKAELEKLKLRINTKTCKNAIIYTTHKTCSSGWFVKTMNEIKHCDITFIGDEVHGLGSTKQQAGLLTCYKNRIGLSATPHRFFDDEGSALLKSYFGDSSFEFTIDNALTEINPITNKTFLCPYYYHLRFAELTEDELERYNQLSVKISKLYAMKKKD
ncbi:MAG: DEAD/DEAH box helicase family protein, partial [Cellulosilyticaceae bacterium]